MLAAAGLFTACLVTSKVDYDEPFIPSRVSRTAPRLGEFTSVPPERDQGCEEMKGEMLFGIHVQDLNREELLRVQYVINHEYYSGDRIEPTGEQDREDLTFCIPFAELSRGCNLVEALVASEFNSRTDSRPYDALNGDLASVHWWVIGDPTMDPTASALDCPKDVLDAGEL